MLDVGMSELLVFGIIALLVLGPDKLPQAARFVGKWYGKIKKFINNVQNEIDRELKLSEFREEMQKEVEKITELERRLQKQLDELKTQPSHINAKPTATKPQSSINYRPYHLSSTIPFRIQYHKPSSSGMESNPPLNQFDTELKIAV
ncbi:MAG: Sec-independent protein translocase protein TatB [Acinetobacter tjernbergiae]